MPAADDKPKKKKSSKKETSKLPDDLEHIRKHVSVGSKAPTHTSAPSTVDAFASLGLDNRLSLQVPPSKPNAPIIPNFAPAHSLRSHAHAQTLHTYTRISRTS
jgi:hypothetical protein